MKFINNILACIALGSLSLLTPSCSDYLEREDDGKLQEEEVFSRYTKVNELVTQLYTDMYLNSLGFNTIYSHNIGTVCDELELIRLMLMLRINLEWRIECRPDFNR
mgnify:CR=1 FL=1